MRVEYTGLCIEECVSGTEADISAAQYSSRMQVHSGCRIAFLQGRIEEMKSGREQWYPAVKLKPMLSDRACRCIQI